MHGAYPSPPPPSTEFTRPAPRGQSPFVGPHPLVGSTSHVGSWLGVPWRAGDHGEATAGVSIGKKAVVEARREARAILQHHRLHVVEHVGIGGATEELERAIHAAQERAHRLTQTEPEKEMGRVRKQRGEDTDATGYPRQGVAEVAPVDLHGGCRLVPHCQIDLARRRRTQLSDKLAQDADATRVAAWAHPLEDLRGPQLWRREEQLLDLRLVGSEERGATPIGSGGAQRQLSEIASDGLARHAQVFGDGSNAEPLQVAQAHDLRALRRRVATHPVLRRADRSRAKLPSPVRRLAPRRRGSSGTISTSQNSVSIPNPSVSDRPVASQLNCSST